MLATEKNYANTMITVELLSIKTRAVTAIVMFVDLANRKVKAPSLKPAERCQSKIYIYTSIYIYGARILNDMQDE
jgi:hypothetical protein